MMLYYSMELLIKSNFLSNHQICSLPSTNKIQNAVLSPHRHIGIAPKYQVSANRDLGVQTNALNRTPR